MTNTNSSVPQAREALNKFKYEVANEIGVPLKQGYNGDLTSAQAGYVGGYMVNIVSPEQRIQKFFTRRNMGAIPIKYAYIVSLG